MVLAPSKALWAAEAPRAFWMAATWWRHRAALAAAPRGDGRAVMALPGLFNSDVSTLVMRRYLGGLGHRAHGWGLGRNLGVRTVGRQAERFIARLETLAAEAGPVTLVGVSLGGIVARMAAHARPDLVRAVITVAAPYAGPGRATNVWRAFEWATGERLDDPVVIARGEAIARPLPVPATAIWSRTDGVVAGAICRCDHARGVEVRSGHLWVQMRPEVLLAIADTLAAPAVAEAGLYTTSPLPRQVPPGRRAPDGIAAGGDEREHAGGHTPGGSV